MSRALASPSIALVALTLLVAPGAGAVEKCKVKQAKDGTLLVSARNVEGTLSWGYTDTQVGTELANVGECVSNGTARNCTLADEGSLTRTTPPPFCKVYLGDDSATSCEAPLKRCTEGMRPICPPDMERVGAQCIDLVRSSSQTHADAMRDCVSRGRSMCSVDTILTCDVLDLSAARPGSCGQQTDGGVGVLWTSATNAENGDNVFDRIVRYDGDNDITEVDLSLGSIYDYFCCAPLGTP